MVTVGTGWQLLNDVVVVLAVKRVNQPHFPFANRSGHGEKGHPLTDRDPFNGLQSGDEVHGGNPKVIVAHSSVQGKHAAGTLAKLRRLAARGHLDGAE